MNENSTSPHFIFPVNGDVMVGEADGVWVNNSLKIHVLLKSSADGQITVNGVSAQRENDGTFSADVLLDGRVNRLQAVNADSGESETITVYVFAKAYHKYRFTVDDFILAFRDLHEHRNEYKSIFENAYLGVFKKAHDLYGSKVHINAFYETYDGSFNLSMMTDKYREEFEANSDWLSFSFHSRSEMPDLPYQNKSYDEVRGDALLVIRELRRIVGSSSLRNTTTLHWGACSVNGTRALRSLGYRALCAYLTVCRGENYYTGYYMNGDPIVSYHLTHEQTIHAEHRCFVVDTDEDVVFAKLHMVLNAGDLPANRVEAFLDDLSSRPSEGGFIQMVIHEQYFYPDYAAYEPDYAERILTMARWMHEHGYEPISLSEIIEENDGMAY
jgi:hypothetical protein